MKPTISLLLLSSILLACTLQAENPKADYEKLAKELEVRELSTLMFANYNDANLRKIDVYLEKHPKSPEREKVLYLRAYSIWSLHRYEEAPPAYAALLKEFPKSKFSRIARIREAAAYLFSGQAEQALPRLQALQKDFPDRPEMYARELAYALSRSGNQDAALAFMNYVETKMLFSKKDRLLPRIKHHFDMVRMIGKPVRDFNVKNHRSDREINPGTLKGKVVLMDFWASWCRPCLAELPHVKGTHKIFSQEGFEIFSVSLDDNRAKLDRMIADKKMDWLHHYNGKKWKNELAVKFGAHSVPANLLIDQNGIVQGVNLRGKAIRKLVSKLLDPQ